jgi:hypothetical protein
MFQKWSTRQKDWPNIEHKNIDHVNTDQNMCQTLKDKKIDALPTPWRTQGWVQVKDSGRGRSRDAFPSSQHFEG